LRNQNEGRKLAWCGLVLGAAALTAAVTGCQRSQSSNAMPPVQMQDYQSRMANPPKTGPANRMGRRAPGAPGAPGAPPNMGGGMPGAPPNMGGGMPGAPPNMGGAPPGAPGAPGAPR